MRQTCDIEVNFQFLAFFSQKNHHTRLYYGLQYNCSNGRSYAGRCPSEVLYTSNDEPRSLLCGAHQNNAQLYHNPFLMRETCAIGGFHQFRGVFCTPGGHENRWFWRTSWVSRSPEKKMLVVEKHYYAQKMHQTPYYSAHIHLAMSEVGNIF